MPRAVEAREQAVSEVIEGTTFVVDAPDGMRGSIEDALEVVRRDWGRTRAALGAPEGATVRVSVERVMTDWFERNDIPAVPPEWAAGLAIPSRMTVLLAPGNPEWERTLSHELAHIGVALASGGQRVPRWFNEGVAMDVSHDWDIERITALTQAAVFGGLYTFEQITPGYPASASGANLAYAQSFHMVRWLRQEHGAALPARILGEMRERRVAWNVAFEAATGRTWASAEAAWRDHVDRSFHWIPAITGLGAGWVLLTLAGLWAWRRRLRQRRARLAALKERERGAYRADPDDIVFG